MSDHVDLEPKTLLNKDGNYCLQHEDILKLMKYVWNGVLLPTDLATFKTRINVKTLDKQLDQPVTDLLETYKTIHAHNVQFKDNTYPSIVALAGRVKNYAENSGGSADSSFYGILLQSCIDLNKALKQSPHDDAKINELKDTINGIVSQQLSDITDLKTAANVATQSLRDYEGMTKQDQTNLQTNKTNVDAILGGKQGLLTQLDSETKGLRDEIAADQKEYDHDVVVACTAVTYIWIPIVGTIAGAVVMGVYADKAVKMKNKIQELQAKLNDDDQKIRADKQLVGDIGLIDHNMDSTLELIGPAIATIEKMMGVWDAIAGDLNSISDFVQHHETHGNSVILKLNNRKIIEKWNELKDAVIKYQAVAYISDVEQKSIEDYVKALP